MTRTTIFSLLFLSTLVGCAAAEAPEATAGTSDALTKPNAYEAVTSAGAFKDMGHLACGRTLVLTRTTFPKGTYQFTFQPCDEEGNETTSHGTFEVIGGWGAGLITNPTLKLTPSAELEDHEPWSLEIEPHGDHVRLTSEGGGSLRAESELD